jgi:hypothetical protein
LHGGRRVREEHHAHARERVIELLVQRGRLRVEHLEADVLDAGRLGLLDRRLDEVRRRVDPDRLAIRADELRELLSGVAEATADVDRATADGRRMERHRGVAVRAQAGREDVAVLLEAVEEDAVPGLDSLFVTYGSDARFHVGQSFQSRVRYSNGPPATNVPPREALFHWCACTRAGVLLALDVDADRA